jgi:hypothetical protein
MRRRDVARRRARDGHRERISADIEARSDRRRDRRHDHRARRIVEDVRETQRLERLPHWYQRAQNDEHGAVERAIDVALTHDACEQQQDGARSQRDSGRRKSERARSGLGIRSQRT